MPPYELNPEIENRRPYQAYAASLIRQYCAGKGWQCLAQILTDGSTGKVISKFSEGPKHYLEPLSSSVKKHFYTQLSDIYAVCWSYTSGSAVNGVSDFFNSSGVSPTPKEELDKRVFGAKKGLKVPMTNTDLYSSFAPKRAAKNKRLLLV